MAKKFSLIQLIADGTCETCGGPVGSMSDSCLDCGADQPMPAGCLVAVLLVVLANIASGLMLIWRR